MKQPVIIKINKDFNLRYEDCGTIVIDFHSGYCYFYWDIDNGGYRINQLFRKKSKSHEFKYYEKFDDYPLGRNLKEAMKTIRNLGLLKPIQVHFSKKKRH